MATFRFLHCADLHLDSPLRGLEADPDAPVETIRGATRGAFKKLVDYAIEKRVDFVVAAGDLYDGDWQDWRTGRFLVAQVRRLTDAAIPFIAIRGNHDAESVITRNLRMPAEIARLLDHTAPETIRLVNVPVSIHGQSFADRAVTENIARAYPLPDADRFNIGLLHSAVDDSLHLPYAPCTIDQLRDHGYQYWALGHVHRRRVLHNDPWIVFPGNMQGRDVNEAGPKGATLVTVADGVVAGEPLHVSFDTVRWARIAIDLSEDADEDTALSHVRSALARELERSEGRLLAVRIILSGACGAHEMFSRDLGSARERIRAEALAVAGHDMIWTEIVDIATSARRTSDAEREPHNAVEQLVGVLRNTEGRDIADDVRSYAGKMLDKANPLRQVLGATHSASAVVHGDDIDDLVRRARDLLLGTLDG